MPDLMGKLGGIFTKATPVIEGATLGSGLIGNIMNAITRGKEVGKLQDAEKKFANLTPEQLSGLVSRAEQPLGQDLLQNVNNLVQADMATRGLSEAPGVFAATEAQALAPYKIEQQKMALELVMKQMGLPIEYAQAILSAAGGGTDLSRILLLMMMNANKLGTNQVPDTPMNEVPDTSGITSNVGDILGTIINQSAPQTSTPAGAG